LRLRWLGTLIFGLAASVAAYSLGHAQFAEVEQSLLGPLGFAPVGALIGAVLAYRSIKEQLKGGGDRPSFWSARDFQGCLQIPANRRNIELDTDACKPAYRKLPIPPMAKIVFACLSLPFVLAALSPSGALATDKSARGPSGKSDFDRTIAALLAEHCLDCHSGAKPKGRLDLSQKKTALKGARVGRPSFRAAGRQRTLGARQRRRDAAEAFACGGRQEKAQGVDRRGAAWGDGPIDPFRYTTASVPDTTGGRCARCSGQTVHP